MVRNSFLDNYGGGTQNLVRHLASKYPHPNIERRTRYYGSRGLYSTTRYIYMYLPADGIDDRIVAAEGGYPGSSKDHYYRSEGADAKFSRLVRRERACGCRPCLLLQDSCTMTPINTELQTAKTARATSVVIHSSCPSPDERHTRNSRNPLPEFCEGLSVGDNIIVRVAEEEKENYPDELYFVAKIEKKAKKLEEGGVYSAVQFKKNDWIVFVRWYEFIPTKKNRRGDRFYKKGFAQWIPCGSIIRSLKQTVTVRWSGVYYQLSDELNKHIVDQGDIAY